MANKFLTIADISYKSADVLHNYLGFTKHVNRSYDDRFAKTGAKIGATTNMRLPARFNFSSGSNIDIQALNDRAMPITLNKLYQRSFSVDSVDMTLSMDDFEGRYLKPAMMSLAEEVDFDGLQMANQYAQNVVGTPGTSPATLTEVQALVAAARRKMSENLAPQGDPFWMATPPRAEELAITYLNQVFNPQNIIGEQYKDGVMARHGGFSWFETQLVPNYTTGVFTGTGLVNGANQSGSTLITDGWGGTTTLDVGSVFTIANVNAVNPTTKASYGYPQQFVVTAKNGAGAAQTLTISPAIVGPGATDQNVSALPADNAALTVVGATAASSVQSIGYHRDAFAFATADLDTPTDGATGYVASVPELNLSVRVVKQFDIRSNANLMRVDLLGGWAPLYPQLAVKTIWS